MANATTQVLNTRSRRCNSVYLERQKLMQQVDVKARGLDPDKLLVALKRSWDGTTFRCHHTELPLSTVDTWSPLRLTWEYQETAHGNEVIIVAVVIRGLASTLSSRDFREVCYALCDRMPSNNDKPTRSTPVRWRLRSRRLKSDRMPRALR